MNDHPTVLYVNHGEAGELIRSAVERVDGTSIEATGGLDALKRLEYDAVDAVVVPSALPDVALDAFVRLSSRSGGTTPCIVVGSVDRTCGPMIQVGPDVSVGALSDRIERAIRDRGIGEEFDRYDRLKNVFLRIAGAIDDAGAIERVVHDVLADLPAYRFVLVGRYVPEDGVIDLRQPFSRRVSIEDVGSLLGGIDGSSVRQAIDERTVTQSSVPSQRGGVGTTPESASNVGELILTTVPLAGPERTSGVALLVGEAEAAPDGAERAILERMGRLCGLALGREPGSADDAPDRTTALVEVLARDLRDALQRATVSLEIAREEGDEAAFDRLEAALEQSASAVDSTLSIASGDVDEPVEIDVQAVAVDLWGTMRTPRSELAIAEPVSVRADSALLERLLAALLRNAIDHGGSGVTVRVGGLSGRDGFFVEDDGPGVPPEGHESVFEWRRTTTPDGTGNGLGYAREIARAHGWTISVTEGTDGGARFEVHTPEEAGSPRDELTALFEEGSGEFVFREQRSTR